MNLTDLYENFDSRIGRFGLGSFDVSVLEEKYLGQHIEKSDKIF